jgi:cobalt-zinc-cadmium efflux system membrane fusion protein
MKIGMRANPEITLVDIVDLNELRAEVFLYEKDLDKIEEGGKVSIEFINKRIPVVTGRVRSINRSIDDMNKTVMLIVSFEKPKDALILPEMFINAKLEGKAKSAVKQTVPLNAMLKEGHQHSIFLVKKEKDKNIIKKVRVKLGELDDEYVQIIPEEPVENNSKVAVKNLLVLDAELKKLGIL